MGCTDAHEVIFSHSFDIWLLSVNLLLNVSCTEVQLYVGNRDYILALVLIIYVQIAVD